MIRLSFLLALDDARTEPARTFAVGVLLAVASVVLALGIEPGLAFVVAVIVAAAATAGAVGAQRPRLALLERNGGGLASSVSVAVAGMAIPAVVGVALGAAARAVLPVPANGDGHDFGLWMLVAVVAPLVAAAGAAWSLTPRRFWGVLAWTVVVVTVLATAPTVLVPLAILVLVLGRTLARPIRRWPGVVQVLGSALAISCLAVVAGVVGGSTTFLDMSLALLGLSVPLVVAIAYLGGVAVRMVASGASRLGPTARLAVAPVVGHRRELGALAAGLAVLATLAGAEGVVGASFGERTERQRTAAAVYLGRAGTADDQVVVVTSWATDAQVAAAVADPARPEGIESVAIGRLGVGGTQTRVPGTTSPRDGFLDFDVIVDPGPSVTATADTGPTWVGVVDPAGLDALGMGALRPALEAGRAVVLNEQIAVASGQVSIATGQVTSFSGQVASATTANWPAVRADLPEPALLMPGVLVAPPLAARMGASVSPARVVVAPTPGGPVVADAALATEAERVHGLTRPESAPSDPLVTVDLPDGSSAVDRGTVELHAHPTPGSERFEAWRGPTLNAVPFLGDTADQGRDRMLVYAGLTLLVAVATTALVLSGSRREDALLDVQGAEAGFRARAAAVQAATVALAGTLAGLGVGVGVSVLAMSIYNGRGHDDLITDIPIVVPPETIVVLLAIPVVAAALAALATAGRRRPSTRALLEASA